MSEKDIVITDPPTAYPANPAEMISAAIARGMGADELGKLLDLQERWQAQQSRAEFEAAMAGFQAHCPTIKKTGRADRYTYAPLDEVLKTIRPLLEEYGLSVRFDTRTDTDGILTAVCTVAHVGGHSEQSTFACPVDQQMKVNASQKVASANSYARRYALMNALGLVASDEDDDGALGGRETISEEQAATIESLIEEVGAHKAKFLVWLRVSEISSIPASRYDAAVKALEAKRGAK